MILWRRLDRPGHEAGWLDDGGNGGTVLSGAAVFGSDAGPCHLAYRVNLDRDWRTTSTLVQGRVGERDVRVEVEVEVEADGSGRWLLDGRECDAVRGCIDIDLNFSPSTNLLPIRRLGLEIGEEVAVRAAWLRFPSFELEPLEQVYRRLSTDRYRYESAGGAFVAEIRVDGRGFVVDYSGIWRQES